MNVFSKPIVEENVDNKTIFDTNVNTVFIKNDNIIKINDYFKNNIDLNNLKLFQLKPIAKYYKIKTTGLKKEIIERIHTFFVSTKNAIIIQSWWRKKIVSLFFSLRGDALKNRNICVNETDFFTLEPIIDIPIIDFFSFRCDDKMYGMNFSSVIELLNQNSNPTNPYNRKPINKQTISNIMKLCNINSIIFPIQNYSTNKNFYLHKINIPDSYSDIGLSYSYFRPKPYNKNILKNRINKEKYIDICNKRISPLDERINNVFILFDRFGNYTQSNWFYSLNFNKLITYYRALYDIWNNRFNIIPPNEKRKMCCLFDPFQSLFRGSIIYDRNNHDKCIYAMRVACITIMENMFTTSIDEEYSKIGVLNCLTALTIVSSSARSTMPWLYESIR